MLIFGRVVAWLFWLLMLTNGVFMLVSPQAWFRLPPWLCAKGTLTEEKYSRGWGAVEIRVVGAVLVGVLIWVICDMSSTQRNIAAASVEIFYRVIVGLVGVLALVNGLFMLASPQAWFRLPPWLGSKGTLTAERYSRGWGAVLIRVGGAVLIGTLMWVMFDTFLSRR